MRNFTAENDRASGHFITGTQPAITFYAKISDRDVCQSYARITDCRLARLFLLVTAMQARAVVSFVLSRLHTKMVSLVCAHLRTRKRWELSSLLGFHEFLMYRRGIWSKKRFRENALSILCKARREEMPVSEVPRRLRTILHRHRKLSSQSSLFSLVLSLPSTFFLPFTFSFVSSRNITEINLFLREWRFTGIDFSKAAFEEKQFC